jgi:hypothetical protein
LSNAWAQTGPRFLSAPSDVHHANAMLGREIQQSHLNDRQRWVMARFIGQLTSHKKRFEPPPGRRLHLKAAPGDEFVGLLA